MRGGIRLSERKALMKDYRLSGWRIDVEAGEMVVKGRRSANGPEIALRIPLEVAAALGPHALRAAHARQNTRLGAEWQKASALPVRTVNVLSTEHQTIAPCLIALDAGTDVQLLLSLPTIELVRELGHALIEAADEVQPDRPKN
jgi:hypothetical protein